jgi:hypothetical protein
VGDGKTAVVKVDNSANGASYFGLGIGTSSAGPTLYADARREKQQHRH